MFELLNNDWEELFANNVNQEKTQEKKSIEVIN
jgi:hypothetical protein